MKVEVINERISKTELAYENWESKYQYGEETEMDTQRRVAKALASVEKNPEEWEEKFLRTLVEFKPVEIDGKTVESAEGLKVTMGGRITANLGTGFKKATPWNCFINGPVSNAEIKYVRKNAKGDVTYPVKIKTSDTPDDLNNIFLTILEQAKTLASEGGYGINFDFIRPRGSLIKGIGIRHPGVVSYMKIWDAVSECIVKGDNDGYQDKIKNYLDDEEAEELKELVKKMARKGAMMGALSLWHPDSEEFIRAKQQPGVLTKFNISVLVDDLFMLAVKENGFYEHTFNGKVHKKVKARELYDLMMQSTYDRAEPGILFSGNMANNNPIAYIDDINCTNPCGEIGGMPSLTTVCLLLSLNLTQYVNEDRTFNWDKYKEDIKIATRMADNVNEFNVTPLPSYQWAVENLRQFGMGINGLGSVLLMLGIKYNSEEGNEFAKKVFQIKEDTTWQASAELAKEKGAFPLYDKDRFCNTSYFKSDRISSETKKIIRKYGVRNAKTTTNPPLGNSSIVCDLVSNGIEPVFSLEYERKKTVDKWPEGMDLDNIKSILKNVKEKDYEYWEGEYNGKRYYYEPHNRGLCEISAVRDYGYNWILQNYSKEKKAKYVVTAQTLKVRDHLDIQELAQFYCNQSISKTVNVPAKYSFEDFKELYIEGWERGLNGLTTYVEGSMEDVLSTVDEAKENRGIIKRDIKLPSQFENGHMEVIKREGMKFYMHFSYLPEDIDHDFPIVLWISSNAKGEARACNRACKGLAELSLDLGIDSGIVDKAVEKSKEDLPHNKLARMISLCLRHYIPREKILTRLRGIEGDNVSSLLTAVRKFLGGTIKDGTKIEGETCPECGSSNLVVQSACTVCADCGNTGCG